MAKMTITNNAKGPRGVALADGTTFYVEPGKTAVDLDVADGHELYEGLVEGDSAPALSSMNKADLIATAEAEGVAIETDDNKADLIRKIEENRGASA